MGVRGSDLGMQGSGIFDLGFRDVEVSQRRVGRGVLILVLNGILNLGFTGLWV